MTYFFIVGEGVAAERSVKTEFGGGIKGWPPAVLGEAICHSAKFFFWLVGTLIGWISDGFLFLPFSERSVQHSEQEWRYPQKSEIRNQRSEMGTAAIPRFPPPPAFYYYYIFLHTQKLKWTSLYNSIAIPPSWPCLLHRAGLSSSIKQVKSCLSVRRRVTQ